MHAQESDSQAKDPVGGLWSYSGKASLLFNQAAFSNGLLVGSIMCPLDLLSIMRFITKKMAGHGIPKAQDLMA